MNTDFMWGLACVGAGLPAKAVYQPTIYQLTLRHRGQARSHTSALPQWITDSFKYCIQVRNRT